MRTVCCSGHWGRLPRGVSARGCLPRGVSAQGVAAPVHAGIHTPPCEQNDRRLWKHNLSATKLRAVINQLFHFYRRETQAGRAKRGWKRRQDATPGGEEGSADGECAESDRSAICSASLGDRLKKFCLLLLNWYNVSTKRPDFDQWLIYQIQNWCLTALIW